MTCNSPLDDQVIEMRDGFRDGEAELRRIEAAFENLLGDIERRHRFSAGGGEIL